MAIKTITIQHLLRGFSSANSRPGLFVSPQSLIDDGRENFFKAIGRYPFKIWGDDRDEVFKEEFERSFLEYFMLHEINFVMPQAFYLRLGSFLRRKMPIYTISWRKILEEMYVTGTSESTGNITGNSISSDARTSGSKSRSESNTESKSNSTGTSRAGISDTPQNQLDLDLDKIDFASQVTRSDTGSNSDTTGTSHEESGNYSVTTGKAIGDTQTDSVNQSQHRSKDVFDIYNEWILSGYDLFTPLFVDMLKADLFLVVYNNGSGSRFLT